VPSSFLLSEIEFVDSSIGDIMNALKNAGIYDDTLLVTAKHGESPIDTSQYVADGTKLRQRC
jgi:arylsulfatase A-like enzyme